MLLEPIQINGIPQGKCFAKKCKDCAHYRKWRIEETDGVKKTEAIRSVCSFETLYRVLPDVVGSIDGCQAAVNHTQNTVLKFGQASIETLQQIDKNLPKLLKE